MSEVLLQQILEEMKGIKTDVSEIKSDVSLLKSDVGVLKQEMEEVKSNIIGLSNAVYGLKEEQQLTNKRLTSIESKQQIIYGQTGSLTESQSKTLTLLERLQSDVEFTYQKTAMNDLKINRIETNSIQNQ